ncbi:hypothetical protein C0Q70_14562 [Pomacea canaliculata]|uniref:Uncharacterized protein n=1 Tax=Pomacea canaliculata TaxID=400727 RepID=A0A2T7NSG8_POMCA|nr:hypothetical protein C0Q70_14562 [Pomacea canaliculata]
MSRRLVRGIDMKKGVLLIVTGVPPNRVASVNTLLRGAITIPDQLFFKQANLDDVPYIDALEPGTAVSSVRPRTHMPRHTPYS